jgi:hypothetical protein
VVRWLKNWFNSVPPEYEAVKSEVDRLAAKIRAVGAILPTYGYSDNWARPHIEIDTRGFHFVVQERGHELQRVTTRELDELLFHVFRSVTFELALKYELEQRVEELDHRRTAFRHQEELLSMLSPSWGEREADEHRKILKEHPFDDLASLRARFTASLREQGVSDEAAWEKACEKYPLPKGLRGASRS